MSTIKDKVLEMLVTPMKESFEKHEISSDYLARKIKQEMNYREPVEEIVTIGTGKSKTTKKIVKHLKSPAAMGIRQRARTEAHKLLGHFPPERKEFAGPGGGPLGVGDTRPIKVVFVSPKESKE